MRNKISELFDVFVFSVLLVVTLPLTFIILFPVLFGRCMKKLYGKIVSR